MENHLELVRDQQQESWNRVSPVWRRSNDLFMEFLRPVSDEIIRQLQPGGTDVILDVASGTGEPGLTIASRLNGGMVIITDRCEDMLTMARENAIRRRIGNIDTWACDACELPFADNTFDAISCRLGFMFFRDIPMAVREISRVLKPGGRIATAVWNTPEKNQWLAGTPEIFRCAAEGYTAGLFEQAELTQVQVTEVPLSMKCPTPEVYRHVMTEVAGPGANTLGSNGEPVKAIQGSVIVIYGEK
jgi:ubiquinone/menaquinone biosynthesis C-methylase UbiE